MKNRWIILLLLCGLWHFSIQAQTKGNRVSINAGPEFPLGTFSETHRAGISSGISFRPRKLKPLHFMASSRISYYPGKKETVSGYSYRYGNYAALGIYGGAVWHIKLPFSISWMAGPALSCYRKTARFNLGSVLDLNWQMNPRWGISPGISLLKENGASILWSAGLKAVLKF